MDVVGLDNYSSGNQNKPYLNHIANKFEFIEGDIRDLSTCVDATQDVDVILHQAALGSVPRSLKHPDIYFQNNVVGFHNILYAAKVNKVKKFIYASSSSTHAKPLKAPYAVSKLVNECYATSFSTFYGLQTIGLRYFNVFGMRQNPNGPYAAVIPKWAEKIKNREPCEIYGDGRQSRDFTYVKNVVMANLRAIDAADDVSGVFDIGCGQSWSLSELHSYLVNILTPNERPLVLFTEPRKGDIENSQADIKPAKKAFGYNPTWTLPIALEDYLA